MLRKSFLALLLVVATASFANADLYTLNVQIIQVCDDTGTNCTNLGPAGGSDLSYLYDSQVNDIWDQAGIDINYTVSQWNNTEAMRLTFAERTAVYNNTFSSLTGDALPGIATDAVQIFFVNDHSGTGFTGPGTGWVDNPLGNPNFSARNAGNAQLFIDGTFSSNGRSVMANEGFAADSLATTIAHEIGHLMGLRHVQDVNAGAGAGTTQDPDFLVDSNDANLMWGAGFGPAYNSGMTVAENNFLNQAQIDAAIYNGLRLDPDGNGLGALQLNAVPEPSSLVMFGIVCLGMARRRRTT